MTMSKVIRDQAGKIINIGDWDYKWQTQPVVDEAGDVIVDQYTDGTSGVRVVDVAINPLPDGASEGTADVLQSEAGGLYVALADGGANYIIGKTAPWRRMTDAEAQQALAAKASATPRFQAIYDAANQISTDDELFPQLLGMLQTLFGADRALQLLAPDH